MSALKLDGLVAQLTKAWGDDLVAVVLFGSAAGGDAAKDSDQNVMVVVREFRPAGVIAAGAVARAWADAGQPPPLTMTLGEWRGSSDIFAIEYADVLERHRVLAGALPVEGVTVDREHLRLQLEREAMGKLLRLRQGMLVTSGDAKRTIALMVESIGTIMVLLRGVLHLSGEVAPPTHDAVARAAAAKVGFDVSPLLSILAHRKGDAKMEAVRSAEIVRAYHGCVERVATWVDGA
ncbi:MAG: nucleotidyltransferase domain-containing protein [Gemmatimonadaceae bacterium]|nr:nucleotidyltransferase domain-containing protein [Gemmatimonadaceae bacterium]